MAMPDTYATSMGTNWRTNYDRYLHIIISAIYGVEAERPDGPVISFTSSSGTYTPDSDVDLKLTLSGSTWTLTDQNDTSEIYFTSGSEGVLQSVTQRNKYTQALTYSHGQIAFVSDSYTRKLTFGYSSGLLTTVSTPGIHERPHLQLCGLHQRRDTSLSDRHLRHQPGDASNLPV